MPIGVNAWHRSATEADLIPECSGLMGAATMLERIMSDDHRVLSY